MENKQDIKQLIGDAFHEIYNQPMDEQLLSDIFSTSTTHQFLSSNLDYSSDQILNYWRSFKECLKHSFSWPVLHHGEFDCFSHPLLSNASKDKENGDNSSHIWGTPLVEINNLFQKFTLIINLYFINKEAKSDKDNNALGRKRKHEDISKCKFVQNLFTYLIYSFKQEFWRFACSNVYKSNKQSYGDALNTLEKYIYIWRSRWNFKVY